MDDVICNILNNICKMKKWNGHNTSEEDEQRRGKSNPHFALTLEGLAQYINYVENNFKNFERILFYQLNKKYALT